MGYFSGWIGKSGVVREPEFYVGADSPHAHRSEVATEDRSWSAMNVDIAAKIAEIARFDHWVGLQLELEAGFGLRGKEARHRMKKLTMSIVLTTNHTTGGKLPMVGSVMSFSRCAVHKRSQPSLYKP